MFVPGNLYTNIVCIMYRSKVTDITYVTFGGQTTYIQTNIVGLKQYAPDHSIRGLGRKILIHVILQ